MSTGLIHIGLDGVVRNQANLENPALSLDDPKTWEDAGLMGERVTSGVKVNQKSAMGYPPIFRAINLIAGDIGRMPFAVYRRLPDGGKEIDKTHPAYTLCRRRVNKFMRAKTFRQTMVYHALIRGNGYAAIVRDGGGRPIELLPLDPTDTTPVKVVDEESGDSELWYLTYAGGEPIRLRSRDVLHFKGLSHDGILGIDVLSLMADALGLGMATRKWVSTFFGNGTNISGILMIPENFNKDKAEAIQKAWAKTSEGLSNANKVALLKDGVKFLPLSSRPEEASAVSLMDHEIMTASNITGVPPHKLGDKSRTSYNSLEIESQEYIDDCLDPWLVEVESECDEKLLSTSEQDRETHFTEFNRNARLRTDTTARWGSYQKGREIGIYSSNDINAMESRPKIGPEGDKRFIPANWQELGAKPPAAPSAQQSKRAEKALRDLAADVLARRTAIEQEKVAKAATRSGFDSWSDEFYREHSARLWDSLAPICRAAEAVKGRPLAKRWRSAIQKHVSARRTAILASKSVPETVAGWSAADLLNLILPAASKTGAA